MNMNPSRLAAPIVLLAAFCVSSSVGAVPDTASTTGAAAVEGVVTAPDGTPCAGAHVLRLFVGDDRDSPPVAVTDASGKFHFNGSAGGKKSGYVGELVAKAAGYGFMGINVHDPSKPQTITLAADSDLTVQLNDSSGQPAAGVRVRPELFTSKNGSASFFLPPSVGIHQGGVSDAEGNVKIANMPQGWTVRIQLVDDRYAQLSDRKSEINIAAAATTHAAPIKLISGAIIEGTLTFSIAPPVNTDETAYNNTGVGMMTQALPPPAPPGKPAPDVQVSLHASDGIDPISLTAVTDAHGHYKITQVPAGRYDIEFSPPPALAGVWTSHGIEGCVVQEGYHKFGADGTLIKGAVLTGTVTFSGTARAAGGVQVSMVGAPGNDVDITTTTDGAGHYRAVVPGGDLEVSVLAEGERSPQQSVSVEDGKPATLNVSVDEPLPASTVSGTVIDPTGSPVSGADVQTTGYSEDLPPDVQTDVDGKFTVPLNGSDGLIVLTAQSGELAAAKPVAALAGETVTIRLARGILGKITGTVVDQDGNLMPGAKVSLTHWTLSSARDAGRATTDDQGSYEFDGLQPTGRYSISVTADGYGTASDDQVTVQTGDTTTVDALGLTHADSKIAGYAVDSHGRALGNAEVEAWSVDSSQQQQSTPMPGGGFIPGMGGGRPAGFGMGYGRMGMGMGMGAPGMPSGYTSVQVNTSGSQLLGQTTTDAQGKFEIDNLPKGNTTIKVLAGDEAGAVQAEAPSIGVTVNTQSQAAMRKMAALDQPKTAGDSTIFAPDFAVQGWINSDSITIDSLRGKYAIIDIWGCCTDQLQDVQTVVTDFGSRGIFGMGLRVPDAGSSAQEVQAHAAEYRLSLPIAVDQPSYDQSGIGVTEHGLGATGREKFVLLDPTGKVIYDDSDFNRMMLTLGKHLRLDASKGSTVPASTTASIAAE